MFKKLEWEYHKELNQYAGTLDVQGMVYEQVSDVNRWHFLSGNQRFVLIMITDSTVFFVGLGDTIEDAMEHLREGEGEVQEFSWGLNEVLTEIAALLDLRGLGLERKGKSQQIHLTSDDDHHKYAVFLNFENVFYLVELGATLYDADALLKIIGRAPWDNIESILG
jgi:hypothetical protein